MKPFSVKPFSVFFLLSSLLLFALLTDARRSPGDYWKSIMNDEPMPEAIKDLLHHDIVSESDETGPSMASHHYIRSFDIRPNVILYHSDADSKRMKRSADGVKMLHGYDKLMPDVQDSNNS